jgi:hypothetical protein
MGPLSRGSMEQRAPDAAGTSGLGAWPLVNLCAAALALGSLWLPWFTGLMGISMPMWISIHSLETWAGGSILVLDGFAAVAAWHSMAIRGVRWQRLDDRQEGIVRARGTAALGVAAIIALLLAGGIYRLGLRWGYYLALAANLTLLASSCWCVRRLRLEARELDR